MEPRPTLHVYGLADIQASTGGGPWEAHVFLIEHLREAPDVHAALRKAVEDDHWAVKNPGQVAAARDMELALGRMAGALATIRRGGDGDDFGSAVDDLEWYAKEFAKQEVFGTERTRRAVARPALEVVRCARVVLSDDDLNGLVDAAAAKVHRARELPVRLDPDQVPLMVKSVKDITELAPSSSEDDAPPQPQEEAWCVGPVVVVTGLEKICEASDIRFSLVRNRDAKGWQVLGIQEVVEIAGLDERLGCLWGNLTKLRRPQILFDAVERDKVVNELEKDAFALFTYADRIRTGALRRDPGTASGACEVPGQVQNLVKVARTQPVDLSSVCQLAGMAILVIELLLNDHPVVFSEVLDFVL
ncbi:unnamed protein product [Urochloa decumbens]|uniref:Uncharacterized protein n=1 Tax=Urochloa decumbens TaxID=240449 RepID=A0ABC9B2T5_9POAL